MYKWNIDIVLQGSGVILPCIYDGPESNSYDVVLKLFQNKRDNEWVGLGCNNRNSQAFVKVGEIASIDIYERKEK